MCPHQDDSVPKVITLLDLQSPGEKSNRWDFFECATLHSLVRKMKNILLIFTCEIKNSYEGISSNDNEYVNLKKDYKF